jgi:hypothetical protein
MRALMLERLDRSWHKPHLIQAGLLLAGARECQVAVVDRIETAAKNAKTHESHERRVESQEPEFEDLTRNGL